MMATTYTVIADPTGEALARGLTTEEAAIKVLNHRATSLQGRAYEVREEGWPMGGMCTCTLWVAARRRSGMENSGIYVVAPNRTKAWPAIAELIVAGRLDGAPVCIPESKVDAA